MKHGYAFRKLSMTPSHRMAMLRNMVSSLFEHGQIKTTIAKAKETARLAEKMITLGKRGDDHARNQASAFLLKQGVTVPLVFGEYAKRYADRPGGYTRIHKFGNRIGDNAPHAIIELIDGPQDLKFEMTARAVGRETVEHLLQNGKFSGQSETAGAARSGQLRELTRLSLAKALKYRSDADKALFQAKAAEWANRLMAEPELHRGLRRIVDEPSAQTSSEATNKVKALNRLRITGRRHYAGERLTGMRPSPVTSAIGIARGALARRGSAPKSPIWEAATRSSTAADATT